MTIHKDSLATFLHPYMNEFKEGFLLHEKPTN